MDKWTFFKIHKYLNNFMVPHGLLRASRLRNFQNSAKTQASVSSKSLFPFVQQDPTLTLASRTIHLRSHDNIRMTVGTLIITVMKSSHAILLFINYTFIRVLEWSSTIRTRPCRRLWNKSLSFI